MPGVTKEQIARAKEWDLLSYLQAYEPQELKKCGRNEYCTVSHDSLKISNGRWHWHSQGIGGRTALDYLVKVRGMKFVAAVEALCGLDTGIELADTGAWKTEQTKTVREFALPEANRYGTAMVSYLQKRGIAPEVISRCIGLGILYESRKYQNCVFVGRDLEGKARYACIRGTGSSYKGEAEGSDKRYGFCLPSQDRECRSVVVAEGPIDTLSLASLRKMRGEDWEADNYLSLGGTASSALLRFLEDHPAVYRIALCLDHDRAGIAAMERIRSAVQESPKLSGRTFNIRDCPPPASMGKDYNEFLQKKMAEKNGRGGTVWQL